MVQQDSLPPGIMLANEYTIERLLGSGGFANTYLARDTTLDRKVAIKEYFPRDFAVRGASNSVCARSRQQHKDYLWGLDRFAREAKIISKLKHPNVVRVYRVFNANSTAYIVLEFVDGADLEVILSQRKMRPTQSDLDSWVIGLLGALDAVHAEKILHRDVKPANIFIRRSDGTPILIDFGASKFAFGEASGTTAAIVSRGYSPQEAYAADAKLQGPWTDIYSLAATLYFALTGQTPPEATERVLADQLVPVSSLGLKGYRETFLAAIDWGLRIQPQRRPHSIAEWRQALMHGHASPAVAKPAEPRKPAFKSAGWSFSSFWPWQPRDVQPVIHSPESQKPRASTVLKLLNLSEVAPRPPTAISEMGAPPLPPSVRPGGAKPPLRRPVPFEGAGRTAPTAAPPKAKSQHSHNVPSPLHQPASSQRIAPISPTSAAVRANPDRAIAAPPSQKILSRPNSPVREEGKPVLSARARGRPAAEAAPARPTAISTLECPDSDVSIRRRLARPAQSSRLYSTPKAKQPVARSHTNFPLVILLAGVAVVCLAMIYLIFPDEFSSPRGNKQASPRSAYDGVFRSSTYGGSEPTRPSSPVTGPSDRGSSAQRSERSRRGSDDEVPVSRPPSREATTRRSEPVRSYGDSSPLSSSSGSGSSRLPPLNVPQ